MSTSAAPLPVVAVQESFRHRPYWYDSEPPFSVECLRSLIAVAQARKNAGYPDFSRRGFRALVSQIGPRNSCGQHPGPDCLDSACESRVQVKVNF